MNALRVLSVAAEIFPLIKKSGLPIMAGGVMVSAASARSDSPLRMEGLFDVVTSIFPSPVTSHEGVNDRCSHPHPSSDRRREPGIRL
jgi:hypothetical protein